MKPLLRIAIAATLLAAAGAALAADDTPVGTWNQVDDHTGRITSIVQITDHDGVLQGKVLKVLNMTPKAIARDGNPPRCTQCDGARHDQPIEGMTIMWGVRKDGDVWDGGHILDPSSGDIYKVKLTVEDSGQKLDVHGYIGFSLFGRSQVWQRRD